MNWMNKLNETERQHIANDAGCKTLAQFKDVRAAQKRLDPKKEICFDCRHIAIKLGLEQ